MWVVLSIFILKRRKFYEALKKLVVFAVVSALMLTFVCSCGGAKTYKYDSIDIKVSSSEDMVAKTTKEMLSPIYEPMFKDSTLEMSSNTAVIKIADTENKMSVKKDGDKYILAGEYAEKMAEAMSAFGGEGECYLLKSDDGYDLVIAAHVETMGVTNDMTITVHYTK